VKILVNNTYGGFRLSQLALDAYTAETGRAIDSWEPDRKDPVLIAIVERLGEAASDRHGSVVVVEVPAGEKYRLREYDGSEWIELESTIRWETAT